MLHTLPQTPAVLVCGLANEKKIENRAFTTSFNVGIPVRPLIDSFDSNINILARNPGLFEESLLEEPRLKSLKILGQQRQIEN